MRPVEPAGHLPSGVDFSPADMQQHARVVTAAIERHAPGFGKLIIAESIRSPKRSRQEIRSRVKPFAGPGATPIRAVRPASRSAAIPAQTASEV